MKSLLARLRVLARWAAAPLLLAGCATPTMDEQAADDARSEPIALDRGDADPALWKLADQDTTIYLFGTMHLLKPDLVWFDDAIAEAFAESDELVLEMVPPPQSEMQPLILERGVFSDGTTLSSLLDEEQRVTLRAAAEHAGVPMNALDKMQPWFAALTLTVGLTQKLGFEREAGSEQGLQARALAEAKPVSGLETFSEQMGFLADLPQDVQIRFLMSGLDGMDDMPGLFTRMERAWATGDVDDAAALINEDTREVPEVTEALLKARNRNWARWIDERMARPGTVFLAVGAGHLAGEGSVQDALKPYGLVPRRVDY